MKAVVITEHGAAPTVEEREDASLTDRPGTMIRLRAAPITPLDLLCASGTSYFGPPPLPYVPGVQGVGVVELSSTLEPGTPVWFSTDAGMKPGDGSMMSRCVVADADIVRLEHDVDPALIAALGLSAIAAWMALSWRGALASGETVLVLGAGGTVGQVGVQAARLMGAGRVVAACRGASSAERARRLGADETVLLDTQDVDELTRRMIEATGGADLVLDPLFGAPATAAFRSLAPRGRLVNLGGSAGPTASFDSATLRGRSLQVLGYTNNELMPAMRASALNQIVTHVAAGELTVDHETVALADVSSAWTRQANGEARRRIVLTL